MFDSSLQAIQSELEEAKRREKLAGDRIQRQAEENQELPLEVEETRKDLKVLRAEFKEMARLLR